MTRLFDDINSLMEEECKQLFNKSILHQKVENSVIDERRDKNSFVQLSFSSNKERLLELIVLGAKKANQTVSMYIENAVLQKLNDDGITIDMLPTVTKYVPLKTEPKRYMIYMITETYLGCPGIVDNKYIATFTTLNAAEKYARNKLEKKEYTRDWCYTIYGRYVEGEHQIEASKKLRAMIKEELAIDIANGVKDGVPKYGETTYIDRLNKYSYPEYINTICDDSPDAKSENEDIHFLGIEEIGSIEEEDI